MGLSLGRRYRRDAVQLDRDKRPSRGGRGLELGFEFKSMEGHSLSFQEMSWCQTAGVDEQLHGHSFRQLSLCTSQSL
jgi:hypothetical protein